jgi:uncharacterized protein
MPFIQESTYPGAPIYQFNGHLQTIIPAFRKVKTIKPYRRQRIETPDGDFLDLDWLDNDAERLVILTHGLEGNSNRPYIVGMANTFFAKAWDILAWNCRSCSGEMNRLLRMYNHGDTDDIELIVNQALIYKKYREIILIGFSMGGNISLKYASLKAHPSVSKVIAYCAPLDMKTSTAILAKTSNWIYQKNFMQMMLPKIVEKAKRFPHLIDIELIKSKLNDWQFQLETFFCTINGYPSLENFFQNGSALNFIPQIKIPALIVQPQNDPISTPECAPISLAENHPFIYLETPFGGGHCGFSSRQNTQKNWAEARALNFAEQAF